MVGLLLNESDMLWLAERRKYLMSKGQKYHDVLILKKMSKTSKIYFLDRTASLPLYDKKEDALNRYPKIFRGRKGNYEK